MKPFIAAEIQLGISSSMDRYTDRYKNEVNVLLVRTNKSNGPNPQISRILRGSTFVSECLLEVM